MCLLADHSAIKPQFLSLAGRPALVLVVPNFFHVGIMEATMLWGNFNAEDVFCSLSQICLDTILCLSSAGSSCQVFWKEGPKTRQMLN